MIASSILFSVRSLAIVNAVKAGALTEPFSKGTFRPACSGFGDATYNAFLDNADAVVELVVIVFLEP